MMTRKVLCLLALSAFLICGEAAAREKLATNGTQLSGLRAASGPIAVSAVTLASGEAIALR